MSADGQGSSTSNATRSVAATGPAAIDWLMLAVVVLLWGSTFATLSVTSRTIGPAWIIAGRMAIATVLLALPAYLEWRRTRRRTLGEGEIYQQMSWRAVGWMSLVGVVFTALPYLAYASASRTAASSVLAICNGAAPIFTILLAALVLKEPMTIGRLLGVALGFGGLLLLVSPTMDRGVDARALGLILAILAAGLYAAGNIATRMAPRVRPLQSSFVLVASGAIASIAAAPLLDPWPAAVLLESGLALLWLGFGPTALGMIFFILLVQRAGPVFTSFSTYLVPLVALGLGVLFLGERPGIEAVAALVLILVGVSVANRRAHS